MAMCMARVGTIIDPEGTNRNGAAMTGPAFCSARMPHLMEHMPGSWPTRYIREVKSLPRCLFLAFMAMNLTWGHDWTHLPKLFAHYHVHLEESEGTLSFLDFIMLHYADSEHRDSDGSHEELPFNHDHKDHLGVDHVYWTPVFTAERFHLPALEARAFTLADDPLDGYRAHALQPPRQA